MKYFKVITLAALLFTVCTAFSFPFFKTPSNKVYGFGVAASFKDTVVYITEIQELDSAVIDSKGFLKGRPAYSLQLKTFMEESMKQEHQTCMIFFDRDIAKLKKAEEKLRKVYKKDKSVVIENIASAKFHFTKPEITEDETTTVQ